MAQLPSQCAREPGRKVCSRAWLPLLAGFAATYRALALQQSLFAYCQRTLETREEHSDDEILDYKLKKKKKVGR